MSNSDDAAQSEPVARIELVRGDDVSTIEMHAGETFRIGRSSSNDIVLPDAKVSRFHAVLSASHAGVVLSDLSSLNGTLVNGRRIVAPVNLAGEDKIFIGDTQLTLQLSSSDPESEAGDPSTIRTQTAALESVMVTVLVADVVSYTKISEALPPEDVAAQLQHWFRDSGECIRRQEGEIDKVIGDCVMALWYSPRGEEREGVERALAAAEEILAHSPDRQWKHAAEQAWEVRVSLNTGEALRGAVGQRAARDFTVLGDTVNIVFRLDKLGRQLQTKLLLGERTAKLLADPRFVSLGPQQLEGRRTPVEVFTLNEYRLTES